MAVALDGSQQRAGARRFAQQRRIQAARRGAGERLCHSKELTPRLVDGARVAPIGVEQLSNVAVVVDANYGEGGHSTRNLASQNPVILSASLRMTKLSRRQNQRKLRPPANLGLHFDFSAQQLGQPARDIEPETGAAVAAREAGVDL